MKKPMVPLVIFFAIVNGLAIVFGKRLRDKGIDTDVVLVGNLVLFLVSLVSVFMYGKAMKQKKGHAIMRNIYGGFMLKFFVLIVAAMVYFFFTSEINKGAIFICLGLYLVYNVIGTRQVTRKQPVHDQHVQTHHHQHHHSHTAHKKK